jgi:hypothetical protein
MLSETIALLQELSRRAADLAATLPWLELSAADLAGEVERIAGRLVDAEERVAFVGPAVLRLAVVLPGRQPVQDLHNHGAQQGRAIITALLLIAGRGRHGRLAAWKGDSCER